MEELATKRATIGLATVCSDSGCCLRLAEKVRWRATNHHIAGTTLPWPVKWQNPLLGQFIQHPTYPLAWRMLQPGHHVASTTIGVTRENVAGLGTSGPTNSGLRPTSSDARSGDRRRWRPGSSRSQRAYGPGRSEHDAPRSRRRRMSMFYTAACSSDPRPHRQRNQGRGQEAAGPAAV